MQRSAWAAENLRTIRRHKSLFFLIQIFFFAKERLIGGASIFCALTIVGRHKRMTPTLTNERENFACCDSLSRGGRLKSQIKVSDAAGWNIGRRTKNASFNTHTALASFLPVHLDNCLFSGGFGLRPAGFKGQVTPAGQSMIIKSNGWYSEKIKLNSGSRSRERTEAHYARPILIMQIKLPPAGRFFSSLCVHRVQRVSLFICDCNYSAVLHRAQSRNQIAIAQIKEIIFFRYFYRN